MDVLSKEVQELLKTWKSWGQDVLLCLHRNHSIYMDLLYFKDAIKSWFDILGPNLIVTFTCNNVACWLKDEDFLKMLEYFSDLHVQ